MRITIASAPCALRRFKGGRVINVLQSSDTLGGESVNVTASAVLGVFVWGCLPQFHMFYQSPALFLTHLRFLESVGKVYLLI